MEWERDYIYFSDMTIQEFSELVDKCSTLSLPQIQLMLYADYDQVDINALAHSFGCTSILSEVAMALHSYVNCGVW